MAWTCCSCGSRRTSSECPAPDPERPGSQQGHDTGGPHVRHRTERKRTHVTEKYVDDADWATAAEQSSEDDEAQEGNVLAQEERPVEAAEHVAIHIVDDNGDDDENQDDIDIDIDDPEAD